MTDRISNQGRISLAFVWLLVLLPLSVDGFWSIPVRGYHLRLNYFSFTILGLYFLLELIRRDRKTIEEGRSLWASGYLQAFFAMGLFGAVSTILNSLFLERSALFLIWSTGTLCLLPSVFFLLYRRVGSFLIWSLLAYASLQSLIAANDLFHCLGLSRLPQIGQVFGAPERCRPHVWYQEPSYLSGFLILSVVLARKQIWNLQELRKKNWAILCCALCFVGVIVSTSRFAWAWALIALSLELFFYLGSTRERQWILILAATAASILVLASTWRYTGGNFLPQDKSLNERSTAGQAALFDFREHPWIGVGPGAAGAYFQRYAPANHPFSVFLESTFGTRVFIGLDRNPLAKDLFTEVLSERGLLGFVAFFVGLFSLLRRGSIRVGHPGKSNHYSVLLAVSICFVYFASQTLPRFDLWTAISLLALP